MTVAMYLRKSRAEELSDSVDETLKRHKEILLDFAEKKQLVVAAVYEEVVSGESLAARPQMLKLLADVEQREYSAVLCMDIDRLGRGAMSDQGVILETLKETCTKIITPRKVYDLNNEMDETYSEFETFLARQELKAIKRRMQRGIAKTIQEGGYVANAPYGYRKTKVNKRPTLAVNEEEAPFVRLIFDLYVNKGMGCQSIADTINAMGAKPHRAPKFGRTSILKILHSPTYTGLIVWNRKTRIQKSRKGSKEKQTVCNPKEKWTIVNGIHPPIISRDLYEQAQAIASERHHPPTSTGILENPLAGLVFCAHCGSPMQRQVIRNGGALLVCQKPSCMVSSSLPLVEKAILIQLKPMLDQLKITQTELVPPEKSTALALRKAIQAERAAAWAQLERLHDLLEQGVYDTDTFLFRRTLLNEKSAKLMQAEQRLTVLEPRGELPDIDCTENIFEAYWSASAADKNLVLKSFVHKIIYCKEKGAKPGEFTLEMFLRPLCF